MKQLVFIFSISSLLLIYGCNGYSEPKISEEQAKSIVLKNHTKSMGEVKIISLSHKGHQYIIKWENKENCENGTDYVNDKNGKIVKGEASIC